MWTLWETLPRQELDLCAVHRTARRYSASPTILCFPDDTLFPRRLTHADGTLLPNHKSFGDIA